jgi:hypothetical protein
MEESQTERHAAMTEQNREILTRTKKRQRSGYDHKLCFAWRSQGR